MSDIDEELQALEAFEILESFGAALLGTNDPKLELMTWPEKESDAAGAKMRSAEARYRVLVEQIPAVTFMAVLGQVENEVYISPHIETLLGYTQNEWLEDPILGYWRLHPDDRAMWNGCFEKRRARCCIPTASPKR